MIKKKETNIRKVSTSSNCMQMPNQIIQDQIQCVQMEFTWSIERNKLSKVFKCLSYEFLIALFDSDWLEIIINPWLSK